MHPEAVLAPDHPYVFLLAIAVLGIVLLQVGQRKRARRRTQNQTLQADISSGRT